MVATGTSRCSVLGSSATALAAWMVCLVVWVVVVVVVVGLAFRLLLLRLLLFVVVVDKVDLKP